MSREVYHELLDAVTHDRLKNWARFMRGSAAGPGTCASAEGRYDRRADPDIPKPDEDLAQRRKPAFIDEHDAMLLERCLRSTGFPVRERAIITAHYLDRQHWQRTCRILGIAFRRYDEAVALAVLVVRNRLTRFHEAKP